MLTEAYIAALLVDEELADMVWEVWSAGVIDDEMAALVSIADCIVFLASITLPAWIECPVENPKVGPKVRWAKAAYGSPILPTKNKNKSLDVIVQKMGSNSSKSACPNRDRLPAEY